MFRYAALIQDGEDPIEIAESKRTDTEYFILDEQHSIPTVKGKIFDGVVTIRCGCLSSPAAPISMQDITTITNQDKTIKQLKFVNEWLSDENLQTLAETNKRPDLEIIFELNTMMTRNGLNQFAEKNKSTHVTFLNVNVVKDEHTATTRDCFTDDIAADFVQHNKAITHLTLVDGDISNCQFMKGNKVITDLDMCGQSLSGFSAEDKAILQQNGIKKIKTQVRGKSQWMTINNLSIQVTPASTQGLLQVSLYSQSTTRQELQNQVFCRNRCSIL